MAAEPRLIEGLEAVDDVPLVELEQALAGRAHRRERHRGDRVGGQDVVFVQHPDQPPVAGGEPAGEAGVVIGGQGRARSNGGGRGAQLRCGRGSRLLIRSPRDVIGRT